MGGGAIDDRSPRSGVHARMASPRQPDRHPHASTPADRGGLAVWAVAFVVLATAIVGLGLLLTHVLLPAGVGRLDDDVSHLVRRSSGPRPSTTSPVIGSDLGSTRCRGRSRSSRCIVARHRRSTGAQIGFLVGALSLEITVFLTATLLVDRHRPIVPRLDATPPTSSYPSGHTAASIALYVGLAIIIWSLVRSAVVRTIAWIARRRRCRSPSASPACTAGCTTSPTCSRASLLGSAACCCSRCSPPAAASPRRRHATDETVALPQSRPSARGGFVTSVGVIAHAAEGAGRRSARAPELARRNGVDDPLWREVPKSKFAPKQVGKLIDDGVDLLFVWGGDGMVQRCIDAVGKAPVTLAILPAGTANLFATNLGIPEGPRASGADRSARPPADARRRHDQRRAVRGDGRDGVRRVDDPRRPTAA